MEINREGCTRLVIITKKYAIKFPNFLNGWKMFLKGILANLEETEFSKLKWKRLCPVVFNSPLGIMLVMPKVRIFTDEEFIDYDFKAINIYPSETSEFKVIISQDSYFLEVENKSNSFGILNGNVVCIDYGN